MTWLRILFSKLTGLFRKGRLERQLDRDVREHLQMLTEENLRKGMEPEEARYAAMRQFGNVSQMKEECRDRWSIRFIEELLQDVRYALRQLRRNPGFTAVAVLTLALGIGATTAIFSVVDGVLLKPLPYPQAGRLVSLMEAGLGIGNPVSYPNFFDWQAQNHVFSGMASYNYKEFTLIGAGRADHIHALTVSSGFFRVLRVKPEIGMGFEPQDDQRGGNVVVLSHSLWQQRFKSNPSIVGRNIDLGGKSFTVIGVMPAGFQFPPSAHEDLWTSVAVDRESDSNIMTGRGYCTLSVIARLKPGVSITRAQTDMDVIARRLSQQYPQSDARQTTVTVVPEINRVVGGNRSPLLILFGVVAGVLLIACANVANLSLARNLTRQREIAVRAAMGAGRARIARQLLTESMFLALSGGAVGTALAAWGTPALMQLAPASLPRMQDIGMDWRVLIFAAALSLLTGLLFGSIPALEVSKFSLVSLLKDAARNASEGISQRRLRGLLVVAETALALILLVGAGLLISSYVRLIHVDPGFNPNGLLTFDFDLPIPPYTFSGALNFLNLSLTKLRALPGVRSATTDWDIPLSGGNPSCGVEFEGRKFPPGNTPGIRADVVSPGYFRTMGIPLLKGRAFANRDNAGSLPVAIINRAFARRYFPNESAVGKHIQPSLSATSKPPWREIIGVVGNVKHGGLAGNFQPEFYMPFGQFPTMNAVVLRVNGDPLKIVPAVRTVIASMDKNVPVYDIETMNGYLSASVARNRYSTLLLGFFGALALLLAALGIYGVVAYSTRQATHEIGIRMALGAQRNDVLSMVLWKGLKLVAIGVAIGVAGALALTGFLSSMLYGVKPTDPLTFVAVSLILIVVALVACYIPARRAAKVDPMVALRYE